MRGTWFPLQLLFYSSFNTTGPCLCTNPPTSSSYFYKEKKREGLSEATSTSVHTIGRDCTEAAAVWMIDGKPLNASAMSTSIQQDEMLVDKKNQVLSSFCPSMSSSSSDCRWGPLAFDGNRQSTGGSPCRCIAADYWYQLLLRHQRMYLILPLARPDSPCLVHRRGHWKMKLGWMNSLVVRRTSYRLVPAPSTRSYIKINRSIEYIIPQFTLYTN